jgi:hypothetical protein
MSTEFSSKSNEPADPAAVGAGVRGSARSSKLSKSISLVLLTGSLSLPACQDRSVVGTIPPSPIDSGGGGNFGPGSVDDEPLCVDAEGHVLSPDCADPAAHATSATQQHGTGQRYGSSHRTGSSLPWILPLLLPRSSRNYGPVSYPPSSPVTGNTGIRPGGAPNSGVHPSTSSSGVHVSPAVRGGFGTTGHGISGGG